MAFNSQLTLKDLGVPYPDNAHRWDVFDHDILIGQIFTYENEQPPIWAWEKDYHGEGGYPTRRLALKALQENTS